jgi:crotonobetaine/carnitine-CoA ligase
MTALRNFLESRAEQYGDREVLRIDGESRTYTEFLTSVKALAAGLTNVGVGAADHVALMMDTSHQCVDAWLATTILGCTEIPLNTKYRGDLLRYLLHDSEATVVICDQLHLPTLLDARVESSSVRAIIVNSGTQIDESIMEPIASHRLIDLYHADGRAPASVTEGPVVLYTSGTTGPSKGVVHSQESMLRLAEYVASVCDYGPSDALLNFFPLYHQNARYTGLMTALVAGCRLQLDSKFSSREFWNTCRAGGITSFNYLGSVLTMIIEASTELTADEARNHGVTKAYGAGAAPGIWEEFEHRFGVRLVEVYGLSEAPMVTANPASRPSPIGSAGREGPLFELKVLNPDEQLARPGEIGEIVVRPKEPHIFMHGYYGRDGDTVRATRNLWFHTGDRGWLSPDGDLFFEERAKDSLRRRGENISAWEVESVLTKHPAILECAVYGVRVEAFDEEVMVAIVPSTSSVDVEAILASSALDLPAYAVPRFVRLLDELPRTDTLKVQKEELRRAGVTPDTIDMERQSKGEAAR